MQLLQITVIFICVLKNMILGVVGINKQKKLQLRNLFLDFGDIIKIVIVTKATLTRSNYVSNYKYI
jgi:hypothetical protein